MPHDMRDQIVVFVRRGSPSRWGFIKGLDVTTSKFYDWRESGTPR
jgi:hypothetical protein